MGEAAEAISWWPVEEPVVMSEEEDVNFLATGVSDDTWKYGSD